MTADAVGVAPLDREAAAVNESPMYELFIGLMTIISLIIVFFQLVVRLPQVDAILASTDTLVCLLFLFDFARSYRRAPVKRVYMFGERPGGPCRAACSTCSGASRRSASSGSCGSSASPGWRGWFERAVPVVWLSSSSSVAPSRRCT